MARDIKICIANDHAGYELKEQVLNYLISQGAKVVDLGCHSTDSVDYTEYAYKAAKAVADGEYDFGIIICGTGLGVSMVANKVKGIRAAVCTNSFMAEKSREHNNANVLCMGARVIGYGVAQTIVDAFFNTKFEKGGRHQERVNNIIKIEESN